MSKKVSRVQSASPEVLDKLVHHCVKAGIPLRGYWIEWVTSENGHVTKIFHLTPLQTNEEFCAV